MRNFIDLVESYFGAEPLPKISQKRDIRLKELCEIGIGKEDADFWIIRRGGGNEVGKPTREWAESRISVRVIATDILDPNYLYYFIMHMQTRGYFKQRASGTLRLVNIKIRDVADIKLELG